MKTLFSNSMQVRLLSIIFFVIPVITLGQNFQDENVEEYKMILNDVNNPCITPTQYEMIEKQCKENIKLFSLKNSFQNKAAMTTALNWPLTKASGFNDCSYYLITNYVDNDVTSGINDYNCGSLTYDGHRGTDILPQPYPFYKMDNDQVEVVAAAAGTIIAKSDGNLDKNCANSGAYQGNYIAIQHADGSTALYYHMKKNSLTSKIVGQTVVTGEFLGRVGSSGYSTTPHLHFEVWAGSSVNTVNDPYFGTCNTFNTSSWWIVQKPYKERGIAKIQTNNIAPVLPACPTTETPNEESCFPLGGGTARFYRWIKSDSTGLVSNMRIINPNGTTFSSWTGTSSTTFNLALYNNTRTLPSVAGTYTYEVVFNGDTCSKEFIIECLTTGVLENTANPTIFIYPNPFSAQTTFQSDNGFINATLTIYNYFGQKVSQIKNINGHSIIFDRNNLSNGIYFATISQDKKEIFRKKIIITD